MYDMKPRYYICRQDGCTLLNQNRPVWPRRLSNGFIEWPNVACQCSPDIEPRRVYPDWHQDELDLAGTEPCS